MLRGWGGLTAFVIVGSSLTEPVGKIIIIILMLKEGGQQGWLPGWLPGSVARAMEKGYRPHIDRQPNKPSVAMSTDA